MKLSCITKKYGNQLLFDDLSFEFDNAGLYVIVGESGCGKTTLLNLIKGIDREYEGYIDTEDSNCSMIYQTFHLIDYFTVYENLMIVLDKTMYSFYEREQLIDNLLKKYHLIEYRDKKVRYLSGGEKQRVAIIRSLLSDSNVLLCDEPTSFLDKNNSILVFQMLKDISKERLVIVVTHNKKFALEYADILLKIEEKKICIVQNKKII